MSLYLIVFILLLSCASLEVYSNGFRRKTLYNILYFIILIMSILRYGQGADYFSYEILYNNFNITYFAEFDTYKDLLFTLLIFVGHVMNVPFELFMSVIAFVSVVMMDKFIRRYSRYPICSLFIAYVMFHLIYHYNVVREGLAVSFFLAYMYPMLMKKVMSGRYYGLGLICTLIHGSAIVTLFFPLIQKLHVRKYFLLLLIVSACLSLVVFRMPFLSSNNLMNRANSYVEGASSSLLAIMSRVAILLPILVMTKRGQHENTDDIELYLSFFLIYVIFASSPLVAARLSIYLHFLVVLVVPVAIAGHQQLSRMVLFALFSVFLLFMYVKNTESFIAQGEYSSNVNVLNYPYISIFDKGSIGLYRSVE